MKVDLTKMFWIGILTTVQLWGSITGLQHAGKVHPSDYPPSVDLYSAFVTALKDLRACRSLTLCDLMERFKVPLQGFTKFSSPNSERRKGSSEAEGNPRSYYGGYGAPAAPAHTYVPAFLGFDPLSILATLAFLAFLLQSFASLFDRSRSIIPAIVSSRRSPEASVQEIADRVLRAMDRYELLNEKSTDKESSENTV